MSQTNLFFDAEAYWRDKPYKKWVVRLATGNGRREQTDIHYIQARNEERAIAVAKSLCFRLKGKIRGTARLATPCDLGCNPAEVLR